MRIEELNKQVKDHKLLSIKNHDSHILIFLLDMLGTREDISEALVEVDRDDDGILKAAMERRDSRHHGNLVQPMREVSWTTIIKTVLQIERREIPTHKALFYIPKGL